MNEDKTLQPESVLAAAAGADAPASFEASGPEGPGGNGSTEAITDDALSGPENAGGN
jgi:hypothetical protein